MHKIQRGFTLIELMISISILSLLLFTASYSYSMLSARWDKELGQFSNALQEAKSLDFLQNTIAGIHPFVLKDEEKQLSFLFIGGPDSILAATRYTLFEEDSMDIIRLSSVVKENGLIDLVYQSVSANDLFLTHPKQEIVFSKKMVLLSNLQAVDFNYFGFTHLDDKFESSNGAKPDWDVTYSGLDRLLMPEKIEVTISKSENSKISFYIYLQQRSERWYRHYREDTE
jgi:prepilin-type N-terminal cleavage/methylation domain-containing protein